MSTQTITEHRPEQAEDKLVPIADASARLGRSVWTLKRLHAKGQLPAVKAGTNWLVPESFISMVFASLRPRRVADFAEVAKAWFAANTDPKITALSEPAEVAA